MTPERVLRSPGMSDGLAELAFEIVAETALAEAAA